MLGTITAFKVGQLRAQLGLLGTKLTKNRGLNRSSTPFGRAGACLSFSLLSAGGFELGGHARQNPQRRR